MLFIPVFDLNAGINQALSDNPALPPERGEVVYSCNQKSPHQIYIIGMGHRDTLTYANGSDTVKSQIEIYRIGEWLIQKEGLELHLPEGLIFYLCTGKSITTFVYLPSTLSILIQPPWSLIIPWLMLRPNPVPSPFFVVKNGSMILSSIPAGIPAP